MKLFNGIFALAAVVLLAGCSNGLDPLSMLNRAQPVGSPYTKYLADDYRALANTLSGSNAEHFARKGLSAVDGMIVEPEVVADWHLKDTDVGEMAEARGELIAALENGGRDRAPDAAAVAQTRFDCWAVQQEKFPGENVSCKEQFRAAMNALNQTANAAPPPANLPEPEQFPSPVSAAARGENVPVQQASFLVFFDWDKYNVSQSANSVLATVAQEIKSRSDIKQVIVIGHTDTSGGEKYNKKLSLKRANAVRTALISHGVPAKNIRAEGHGKSDLLVKTPDNVREPQNRRAQITFE